MPPVAVAAELEAEPPLKERLRGTNINPETFLATDYLNHFTEVVMLIEMLPSMPECIEDIRAWHPKSYEEHFRDSVFSDKDLAILAYQQADPALRVPFDSVIASLHILIPSGIKEAESLIQAGETGRLQLMVDALVASVHGLLDKATAYIHGRIVTMDQAGVDAEMNLRAPRPDAAAPAVAPTDGMDQSDIDSMFD